MSDTNFYSLKIVDVQPETDQAVCISFEVPTHLKAAFTFAAGQFLTLQEKIDGETVHRAYSICSGIDEKYLSVGIKRVKNGKFSNYANDQLKIGDTLNVMPPQGDFKPQLDAANKKNYMCLAVGSGITPILSIIKSILASEPDSQVSLVYGNTRSNTVMFKEALSFLKNRYMARFNWINIMSQEDQGADVLKGRINNAKGLMLHNQKLINIHKTDQVFICGPEAMISEVSRGFRHEGLTKEQINYELFAASAADASAILEKAQMRIHEYGEDKVSKVTVISDDRSLNFELATVGANILDAGMENGMELPYSCKAGVCSTCKCKVIKGRVDMDISHGLEQHEIDDGFILSCQAHPVSDEVIVSFDER